MSLNKKQLGNDTKSARKKPPVRQPNQNAPAFFMEDPRQLLPKNLIQPMYKHGGRHGKTTRDHWKFITDPNTTAKYIHNIVGGSWTDGAVDDFIYRLQDSPGGIRKPVITGQEGWDEEHFKLEKGTDAYKDIYNQFKGKLKDARKLDKVQDIYSRGFTNRRTYEPSQEVLDRVAFQKAHWGEDKMGDTDELRDMIRMDIYGSSATPATPREARKVRRFSDPTQIAKDLLYQQTGGGIPKAKRLVTKKLGGGDINMFDHGGPHDRYGKRKYVGYDRLLQDWDEQIKGDTPWGDKGQLFYQGYDNAIGDYSPLHPNVRKLIDMNYLEDYVSQAAKSSGIYGGSGDNAYKKKAMMGQIPVRFDEAGKAQILTDARGGFGARGKGIKGVEYFPVNWEEYHHDQTSDPTNEVYGQSSVHNQQFFPPVTVEGGDKVPSWIPKGGVSVEQNRGITNLIHSYNTDKGVREAVDLKKFSSDGKLSREQAYKLLTKDPELYEKAMSQRAEGMDQVRGITEEEAQQNKYTPVNTGVALIDDISSGVIEPIVQSAKSLWNDPGQITYIPDAYKAMGQTWMPEIFGEVPLPGQEGWDPEYLDRAIKGVNATGNLLDIMPFGYGSTKVAKPLLKKVVAPLYKRSMQSSRLAQKTLNPVWNTLANKNIIGSKTHKGLTGLTKKATFDNMALIKGTAATPYFYNEYRKNPTWGNLGMTGYAATGLIPGFKYIKPALGSGKRYIGDVIGASKHAGKFKLPTYKNVWRAESPAFNQASTVDDVTGRWFGKDPKNLKLYAHKAEQEFPHMGVKVMRTRMPQHKIEQQFGAGMPEEARMMSLGHGDFPVSALDREIGGGAASRWMTGVPTGHDVYRMQNDPLLFNATEGIVGANIANQMRGVDNFGNILTRSKATTFPTANRSSAFLRSKSFPGNQEGFFSQYLPFSFKKQGGDIKGGTPIWEGLF